MTNVLCGELFDEETAVVILSELLQEPECSEETLIADAHGGESVASFVDWQFGQIVVDEVDFVFTVCKSIGNAEVEG